MAARAKEEGVNARISIPRIEEERVTVSVPRGAQNDDPNFFVSVNGVNYLLPKGQKSRVPRSVADEYYRSAAAQEALDRRMQAMIEASRV